MKKTVRKADQKNAPVLVKPEQVKIKKEVKSVAKVNTKPKAIAPAERTISAENLGLAEIKELIELIAEKQFNDFELERGTFRLRLSRGGISAGAESNQGHYSLPVVASTPLLVNSAPVAAPVTTAPVPVSPAPTVEENLHIVTSPIVGTFYRAASPTAAPFASIGDSVTDGKTLCIIEAMKLMNEIQSDISGTVAKIFVDNAQPVEYGQPLFGIKV